MKTYSKLAMLISISLISFSCASPNQISNVSNKSSFNTKSVEYNEDAYLLAFPDIANAVKFGSLPNGYTHYKSNGINEGRLTQITYLNAKKAVDSFSEKAYLLAFPDIDNAVKYGSLPNGYAHFKSNGYSEGRLTQTSYLNAKQTLNNSKFKEDAYLLAYPDIANAVKYGFIPNGYTHYINNGINEGRLTQIVYLNALNYVLYGDKSGNNINFGNSNNTSSKYVEITSTSNQVAPNSTITLTAKAFNNLGTQILDSNSNDKWTWSASPLTPFRGFLDYDGTNIAKFTGAGTSGNITITAKSKLTGKTASININVLDVDPKIESILPNDNTLTFPSNTNTISNLNLSSGTISTNFSTVFSDDNKDWVLPSQLTVAYERNINLSGSGISTNIPSSQMDNYDIYVGGFSGANSSHYISGYNYQLSADKRTFSILPTFYSSGLSTGYIIINARQNGVVKRKHRFNITTGISGSIG
ncbi:MAG: hypothetical protein U0354_00765 [Candidatus Sericytochromatia bacterium]